MLVQFMPLKFSNCKKKIEIKLFNKKNVERV